MGWLFSQRTAEMQPSPLPAGIMIKKEHIGVQALTPRPHGLGQGVASFFERDAKNTHNLDS